jgi:hypothetical protein
MVSTLLATFCRHYVAESDTNGDRGNMKASITVPAFIGELRKLTEAGIPEYKPTTTCKNTYSALRIISGFSPSCNIFAVLGNEAA